MIERAAEVCRSSRAAHRGMGEDDKEEEPGVTTSERAS